MALIVALPAVGVIILSGFEKRNEDINKAHDEIQKLADIIASAQKNLVAGAQQLVGALAQLPEVKSHNTAKVDQILRDILRMNPQYLNIFIADRTGSMWSSALPMKTTFSIRDRRYFTNTLATGQFSSGECMIGRILGKPTLSFGYPYKNQRGEVAGVIAVNFDMEHFRNLLQLSKLPPGSSYSIIDHKGVIISRGINPAEFVGKPVNPELLKQMQAGPDGGTFTGPGGDDIERFSSFRKLYLNGEQTPYMYIRTSIPVKAAVAKANRALYLNLALLSPFMMIAFYLAWVIGKRSIVDRLSVLREASQRFAGGDLKVRVAHFVKGGELGELGNAFDAMASALDSEITAHKQLEESLKVQFNQISTTFDELNAIVYVTELGTGNLLFMNKYGELLCGSHWQGRACYEVIGCGQTFPCEYAHAGRLVLEGELHPPLIHEYQEKKTGRWYQCLEKAISWTDGRLVRMSVAVDITDLKDLDRLKDDLISAVSHEMRTPLTAIKGYIEFMLEHKVDEAQVKEYLSIVKDQNERLIELISDFLDLQRVKARQAPSSFKLVQIQPLLDDAVSYFADSSPRHKILSDSAVDLPPVHGDAKQLQQVLTNLLSNAIKYSPEGGEVVIGARHEQNDAILLWVKDDGIGIPPDVKEKIFERFYQVEMGDRRKIRGTGLGLALVREIVDAHGGRVWVESTVGAGSTFYVSLPVAKEPSSE